MFRLSNSSFKSKLLCRVAYSESKLFFPLSRCYTIIRSYLQSGFLPCFSVYYSVIHVLSQRLWNFSFHAADTWLYTSLWSSIIWSSHCSWVPSNSQHPGTFFSWFKSYLWCFILQEIWNSPCSSGFGSTKQLTPRTRTLNVLVLFPHVMVRLHF